MRRSDARRYFEWGYLIMYCCNRQNRCCRCCCSGNGNNSGTVTLSSLSSLSRLSGGDSSANTSWPVYVSVPAFLWENEEDSSDSCGCCGCCRG